MFPTGYTIDATTGALAHTSGKGRGLRLEFSFNSQLDPSIAGNTGIDPYTQWVSNYPTQFDPNKITDQRVFVRFALTDDTKYIAEKQPVNANDKLTFTLNLQTLLEVNAD